MKRIPSPIVPHATIIQANAMRFRTLTSAEGQANAPTAPARTKRPRRPSARSITIEATACVFLSCSRQRKAALITSPPTVPGITRLNTFPMNPRRHGVAKAERQAQRTDQAMPAEEGHEEGPPRSSPTAATNRRRSGFRARTSASFARLFHTVQPSRPNATRLSSTFRTRPFHDCLAAMIRGTPGLPRYELLTTPGLVACGGARARA